MSDAGRDKLGLKLFKRAEALKEKRRFIFDVVVQELYQYFLPDLSDVNTEKTEGVTGWFQRIYDSAPIRAVSTCSVGIRNWVTPSTEPWLDLSPPPNLPKRQPMGVAQANGRMSRLSGPQAPQVDDNGMDEASRWCADEATGELQDLQSSNFYAVIQAFNRAACCSGTALMFCEEGKDEAFKFEQFKFGTFAISESDQKLVDTVFRWFKLTVRQAEQRFGVENLPKKMQKDLEKEKFDAEYTFIHFCGPKEDLPMEVDGLTDKAFASIYFSEIEKKVVSKGGYEEMPYFCLRFTRWGTDNQPYGCSPAYETLPEARQLNYVTQYSDAQTELKAFPRFIIPDSITGEVELAAGGTTVVKSDDMARGVKPEQWLDGSDSRETLAFIERKEAAINKAFFVDVFNALGMLQDKDMTATEVAQRIGEKLDQFTGTFDQYRTELINPLVRRMMGIRLRSGRTAPPPQSMMVQKGNDPKAPFELAVPKIEIKSRVTLALNEVKNVGTAKTLATLEPIAEARPEILDNFDLDELARGTGRDFGMRERYIRPMKQVQAMRQQRQKMIQEQHALEMAQGAAKAGKDLGKAPQKMQDAAMGQLENFQQAANG